MSQVSTVSETQMTGFEPAVFGRLGGRSYEDHYRIALKTQGLPNPFALEPFALVPDDEVSELRAEPLRFIDSFTLDGCVLLWDHDVISPHVAAEADAHRR